MRAPATADLALLVLRVVLGVIFVAHGAQKLFGAFGGQGIGGTADFFGSLGLEPGGLFAVLAGLAEFGGGLLLLAGLLTPLASLAIIVVMVVATATVNGANGFFNGDNGFEYNLALVAMAVALLLAGPGRVSLDRALDTARLLPAALRR